MAHGGHGCISVSCNVTPEPFARFMQACIDGDWPQALALQDRMIRLHKALFLDSSPAPTKFAMAHLGLCREDVRLPITPCDAAVRPLVLAALEAAMGGLAKAS
jgi:4-hydroxy-tetrahydrodipicolinate synthase